MQVKLVASVGALCASLFVHSIQAESISGNIDSDYGAIAFAQVQALDGSGNPVDTADTDGSGNYTLFVPGEGDYWVYVLWWSMDERRVVAEAWPDAPCLNCDVTATGNPITVGIGEDLTGYDLNLSEGAQVTGSVVDAAPPNDPLHPVIVDIYDASGNFLGGTQNEPDGQYTLHAVPAGDYRIVYNATSGVEAYLDKLQDGTLCQNITCDMSATGTTQSLSVGSNLVDMTLDRGILLSGSVTNDYGFPLPWAHVEILDDSGASLGFINMDEDEFWEIPVPVPDTPPATYYAQVLSWSLPNFTPEVWDNIACNGCDPLLVTPTPISVDADDLGGIDFVISGVGYQISGNVQDSLTNNLEGVDVCALKVVHQVDIGCATTDIDGNYNIPGLQDSPDDITVYIANTGSNEVVSEMWGGPPGECCDFDQAQIIDMSAGDVGGIDFALQGGNLVKGTLFAGGAAINSEGSVSVYDTSGNLVDEANVDDSGSWSLILPDGDYHFYFDAWGAYETYVSEIQEGQQCPWLQCFPWDWTESTIPPLTVDSGWTNPYDVDLEQGIIFEGTLTDENTSDPIDRLRIYFYDDDIYQVGGYNEAFLVFMRADPSGNYRTEAVPARNILAFTTGYDLGYGREFYDNQKCDPVDCDDALANRTVLQVGVDFNVGDVVNVDFNLIRRVTLAGNVSYGGGPLGDVRISIWDTKNNLLDEVWTNGAGNWFTENVDEDDIARGFPAADYYFTANGEEQGYIAQAYSASGNQDCPQEYCVQGGTPPVTPTSLNGSDLTNVDFVLNSQAPAAIAGSLLTSDGSEVGGAVRVFNALGYEVETAWVQDEFGNWQTSSLGDGIYYLATGYMGGNIIDDAWDGGNGTQCPGLACGVTSTTAVVIQNGMVYTNGQLVPDDITIDIRVDYLPDGEGGTIYGELLDEFGNPLNFAGVTIHNIDLPDQRVPAGWPAARGLCRRRGVR
jgi:hypothetical protein